MMRATSQQLVERLGTAERELQRCQQSPRPEFQKKLDARDKAQNAVLARMTEGWQPIAEVTPDHGKPVQGVNVDGEQAVIHWVSHWQAWYSDRTLFLPTHVKPLDPAP